VSITTLQIARESRGDNVKTAFRLCLTLISVIFFGVAILYNDARSEHDADKAACPLVHPSHAVEAVVQDLTRSDNPIFNEYHLTAKTISIDFAGVQIGPNTILVPFRLSNEPNRQYFGMPRCAALSSVEYAHD